MISAEDQDQYSAITSSFSTQPEIDQCLPTALRNVLHELADRKDDDRLRYSISELSGFCDYRRDAASSSEETVKRLSPELEQHGYTVKAMMNLNPDELQQVIESGRNSFPIVDIEPTAYFEQVVGWNPEPSRSGYNWSHELIPFKVNSNEILFFDPMGDYLTHSIHVDSVPTDMPKSQFWELWTRNSLPRFAMWVDRWEQQTLESSGGSD